MINGGEPINVVNISQSSSDVLEGLPIRVWVVAGTVFEKRASSCQTGAVGAVIWVSDTEKVGDVRVCVGMPRVSGMALGNI